MYTSFVYYYLSCLHVIVDLEQEAYGLRRQLNCTCRDEQWLHNVFFQDVRDKTLGWEVSIYDFM